MSRIETEARSVLLDRREALRRAWEQVLVSAEIVPEEEPTGGPLGERVARELAEVDAALRRIADGKYGRCIACGGPLGLQRLRAIPEARFCLGCSGHRPSDD